MVLKWLKLCNDNSLNREMVSGIVITLKCREETPDTAFEGEMVSGALCHSQKTQAGVYNPIEILRRMI